MLTRRGRHDSRAARGRRAYAHDVPSGAANADAPAQDLPGAWAPLVACCARVAAAPDPAAVLAAGERGLRELIPTAIVTLRAGRLDDRAGTERVPLDPAEPALGVAELAVGRPLAPADRALLVAFLAVVAAALRTATRSRDAAVAERQQREFIAVIAHELRTPVTSVVGFSDVLAGTYRPADEQEQRVLAGRIAAAGRELARLLEDMLDVTGLSSGGFRIKLGIVDIGPILEDVAAAPAHAGRVAVAATGDLPPVLADPERLRQVLGNLVGNACKFSPAGALVRLWAARDGDHVAITVSDEGMGIAPALHERVFERFYQADGDRREGMGLGLYLARQLTERMGGSLTLASAPACGSTFTLRLPWVPRIDQP